MNYREFVDAAKELLTEKVSKQGKTVSLNQALKTNSRELDFFTIGDDRQEMRPAIYIDVWYQAYLEGESLDDITDAIIQFNDACYRAPIDPEKDFINFENASKKITLKLINTKMNDRLLRECPHIDILDMSAIFCMTIIDERGDVMSARINYDLMKGWGKDEKTLFEIGKKNTKELLGVVFESLSDFIGEKIFGQDIYVLTNRMLTFGASAMLLDDVIEDIAENFKDDIYIIPSSVNELLIVPYSVCRESGEELNEMIESINQTIEDGIILSDHAYLYRRNNGLVSV